MRLQNPFAVLSTTGIDSQVLAVLTRSERFLTVTEIHQLLPEGGSHQGVRLSVQRLSTQGIVLEQRIGRSLSYQFNRQHLLAEAVLAISRAKHTLITEIKKTIDSWAVQPLAVFLFGSAARNEMTNQSDIDLFFALETKDVDSAQNLIHELTQQLALITGNDVRPLVYAESEISETEIFRQILSDGIHISGEPNWLKKALRSETY